MKSMMLVLLFLACTGCATGRVHEEFAVSADAPDVSFDEKPKSMVIHAEYRVIVVH